MSELTPLPGPDTVLRTIIDEMLRSDDVIIHNKGEVAKAELLRLEVRIESAKRVCRWLHDYQNTYEWNTGDKMPGNNYYSSMAMKIVDAARAWLDGYPIPIFDQFYTAKNDVGTGMVI
jgi:hypothetical protein